MSTTGNSHKERFNDRYGDGFGNDMGDAFRWYGSGAAIFGLDWDMKVENWLQGQWEGITGKSNREAQEEAQRAAVKARRDAKIQEIGARQQADSLAYAGLMRGNTAQQGGGQPAPGVVGSPNAEGTLGSMMRPSNSENPNGMAGTF